MVTLFTTLSVHLVAFWGVVWLANSPSIEPSSWLLAYLAGAGLLVASRSVPRLRIRTSVALQVVGYAVLLAAIFWGANMALDQLGNSVKVARLPPELRTGLPLHLVLVPGVASVGLAASFDGLLRSLAVKAPTPQQNEA